MVLVKHTHAHMRHQTTHLHCRFRESRSCCKTRSVGICVEPPTGAPTTHVNGSGSTHTHRRAAHLIRVARQQCDGSIFIKVNKDAHFVLDKVEQRVVFHKAEHVLRVDGVWSILAIVGIAALSLIHDTVRMELVGS